MTHARVVDPADDARIERTMSIMAGQLARARARPERRLIALYEADAPVGIAVFARTEGRAMPFRVARAELAGALGRELACHALPDFDELYVAVENDATLLRLLLDAGASVVREVHHYSGRIDATS